MTHEIAGKYYGTEINEKWWRRYTKDKMLARGNGLFSYTDASISFLRHLTKVPIDIKFSDIVEFKTGKWHAGQWGAGRPIIKVIWKRNNLMLSSGFSMAIDATQMNVLLGELNNILEMVHNHPAPQTRC